MKKGLCRHSSRKDFFVNKYRADCLQQLEVEILTLTCAQKVRMIQLGRGGGEVTAKEVIKRLEANGWLLKSVEGSHHHFVHPEKKGKSR